MKMNIGYRLGQHIRQLMNFFYRLERKCSHNRIAIWLIRTSRYLLLAVAVGLLLIGAFYLALFLALMAVIAIFLSKFSLSFSMSTDDSETLNGYHSSGPEGPGYYYEGARIDRDDE